MTKFKILAAVGKGGKNNAKDVKLVEALLNVYARINKINILEIDGKSSKGLEEAIAAFQKDYVNAPKPDSRVDVSGTTFKKLNEVLSGVFKALAVTKPTYGVVTWESEGTEGGRYHSRKLHVPSSSSGLTIGRGYDMRRKSAGTISTDLTSVGIDANHSAKFKLAAGLFGEAAKQFIIDNDLLDFQISVDAQKSLFKISYDLESAEVKRICEKSDVVLAYGKTDWAKLNASIKDITIDLKFRGDYTGASRKNIQKTIADNDLEAFKKVMLDKTKWSNVPEDRFNRRKKYLENAK